MAFVTGLLLLTFSVALVALFYHAVVTALLFAAAIPGIGRVISVTRGKGTDTVKLSLGTLFSWSVSVNAQKGTVTGSIQIDSAKRWGVLGVLVALIAAVSVPTIAGLMMPAALVVVGIGLARRLLGSTPPPDVRHTTSSPTAEQADSRPA